MTRTILVIEDNAANLKLATTVLEHAGYRVLNAGDGAIGMAVARYYKPDLILMDIQLPDMDGLHATRLLKADRETSGIPIVALTALAMKGDQERILAAGCDGHIAKPFDYKNFLVEVASILARSEMEN